MEDDGYVPAYTCGQGVCEADAFCLEGEEGCEEGDPTGDDTDCNGLDDDCDGEADNHFEPDTCGQGVCERESTCTDGTEECDPGDPTGTDNDCNGLDDNCNGFCDENYTTEETCGLGPCERYYQCVCGDESCTRGTPVSPTDTTCNAQDEDCDGVDDDDYIPWTCGQGACERDSTCIDGEEDCVEGEPGMEICGNEIDEDCDGHLDNGCGECSPCTDAVDVLDPTETGGRFAGSTTGTGEISGSCGGADAPEAVYYFTVESAVDVFITTHGSSFDTVVYVRECTCGGDETACNDDADGMATSVLHLRDLPAGTYNIFVDGKTDADVGDFQLDVYVTEPGLEGDRCGDPVMLTGDGYTYADPETTCNLTHDYSPATTGDGAGDCGMFVGTGLAEEMVFYLWIPSDSTVITLDTCGTIDLDNYLEDTAVYMRSVCNNPGASNQPGCDEDDNCGGGPADNSLSELTVTLDRGLYYVFVDGYSQPDPPMHYCGEFLLTVTGL